MTLAPPRRRLILMRHGAVQYVDPATGNPLPAETVPLTAEGWGQALTAGQALAGAGIRPDLCIHTGLPRTEQTLAAVRQGCGGPAPEVWPALQEIHGGRLRDIPPEALARTFTALQRGPLTEDTQFLQGESLGALLDRVLPALAALRARTDWHTALVVAHGVVNAALLSHVVSGGQRLVLPGWQQNPACLNLIDLGPEPGTDVLRSVNLNPCDWLQPHARHTTMELLLADFSAHIATRQAPG